MKIMKKLFFIFISLFLFVETASAQSLLRGATPSNFSVPAGWKVHKTQDFESGSLGSGEHIGVGASITTTRPHTGSRSVEKQYTGDGQGARWGTAGVPGREHYTSFWEYRESQGRFNDEMFIWQTNKNSPFQEVIVDWYPGPGGQFNAVDGELVITPQGNRVTAWYFGDKPGNWGQWEQWEIHFRANTPGSSNGFIRAYRNGTLLASRENENLNGTVDMTGAWVQAGGTYTKATWRKPDNSCAAFIGDGVPYSASCGNFNSCPCPPNVPVFKRFIDDAIVLVPSGGNSTTEPPTEPLIPDVTVTSLSYANGIFTSTVKNQGTAATPAGKVIGVGYSVDGVHRTWGTVANPPLAAGQSATVGTNGGPYTIPTGTHTITAFGDDVNRFAESDETNNRLSRSITVP